MNLKVMRTHIHLNYKKLSANLYYLLTESEEVHMKITVTRLNFEEFAEVSGCIDLEEAKELWKQYYGENAEYVYTAATEDCESAFVGIETFDKTYNVYGARRDEEHTTKEHMLEKLLEEFI